jgi:hypothetical protein
VNGHLGNARRHPRWAGTARAETNRSPPLGHGGTPGHHLGSRAFQVPQHAPPSSAVVSSPSRMSRVTPYVSVALTSTYSSESYGSSRWWCGPLRLLEPPVVLAGRCLAVCATTAFVDGRGSAAPPPVELGPELAFQLHEAPDPGAVGADVGLDVGGHLLEGGRVDAEQFRAPLQRRGDRPAQIWVVPSPPRHRLSNKYSRANRQRCIVRSSRSESEWAALPADCRTYRQQ